jgi:hypothetical protein
MSFMNQWLICNISRLKSFLAEISQPVDSERLQLHQIRRISRRGPVVLDTAALRLILLQLKYNQAKILEVIPEHMAMYGHTEESLGFSVQTLLQALLAKFTTEEVLALGKP